MGTIHRLIEAKKAERQEQGKDAGFSLIELIIVVVILGILVAIAIPIFGNIQKESQKQALNAAAANGAAAAAAFIAQDDGTATAAEISAKAASAGDADKITVTSAGTTIDTLCATATGFGMTASSGPADGCNSPATDAP